MEQVLKVDFETARYIVAVDHTEWKYFKDEFSEAALDVVRQKHLSLDEDFFDKSDFAQLTIEILNGEVFWLKDVRLSADYKCYYNEKTKEYIGILISEKDQKGS